MRNLTAHTLLPACIALLAITVSTAANHKAAAATSLEPAYADQAPQGPKFSRGVIVYSHGRSLTGEDSTSPSPAYLKYLAKSGWDVMRFNRPSVEDTLPASSADLAKRAAALKAKGYKRVILTGQSFGAFLSIMAAEHSKSVDGVIATSPAAFGSYSDSFDTWKMNATELYASLGKLRHVRVLLAFFHGDDYDPGGRGERSRSILADNGVGAVIIDQPHDLTGHLAAAGAQFAKRYGLCLARFSDATEDETVCAESTILHASAHQAQEVAQSGIASMVRPNGRSGRN